MDESIYDDLPDDPELAFVQLESYYKNMLDDAVKNTEEPSAIVFYRSQYANQVVAAAQALDIEGVKTQSIPSGERENWRFFDNFDKEIASLIIQIRIRKSRRKRDFSVALDSGAKQKIRHYIEQIKQMVEASDVSQNKKDSIFKKLADLEIEVDRDRTRFEVIADALRGVARLSGDVEREGAEPWWKWVKLIFGEIDEAKDGEPKTSLPAPEERKKLEPPRKQLPGPEANSPDDEIPF
jgi:hypothetical protein